MAGAAALGFGLLDAVGAYEVVRGGVLSDETLHSAQRPEVTAALRPGSGLSPSHGPSGH